MSDSPISRNGSRVPSWLITLIIVLVTWIFSAGATYEWAFASRLETDRRLDLLEENQKQFVSQKEYDRDNTATNTWLNRIEQKIDEILERGK